MLAPKTAETIQRAGFDRASESIGLDRLCALAEEVLRSFPATSAKRVAIHVDCPECGGSGWIKYVYEPEQPCEECKGEGFIVDWDYAE